MKKFPFFCKCIFTFSTLAVIATSPLSYIYWTTGREIPDKSNYFKKAKKRVKRSPNPPTVKLEKPQIPESVANEKIFKPLVSYDFSQIQNKEDSPLADVVEDRKYLIFVWSLWRIMNSTLWVDHVYGLPWIRSIEAIFPQDTFKETALNISVNKESHPFKTYKIEDLDPSLKAEKIAVELTTEDIQKLKKIPSKEVISQIRQNMGEIFSTFFARDWIPTADINELTFANTVKTFFSTFASPPKKENKQFNQEIRTLRFIRKFKGKFYYLDINFNTKAFENSLMIQYVWYKDAAWYRGDYYQANGEYNNYRSHLGGNTSLAKAQGYPINNMDEEFKTMFENIYQRPDILYKFVLTIKNCLENPECSLLFHRNKDDYYILNQRHLGISSKTPHTQKIYKHIHPFSNHYHRVDKLINNDPPGQFLFPVKVTEEHKGSNI